MGQRNSTNSLVRYGPRIVLPVLIVGLPLLLGASSPTTIIAATAALLLAMFATVYHKGPPRIRHAWSLIACGVAIVATALQLIPLPVALLEVGAPGAHELLALGDMPSFYPASMDPPATALALVRYIGVSAAAVIGYRSYARRPRELFIAVSVAGAVVVMLGGVHVLLGWHQPYGQFGLYPLVFPTSFVNPNHLGGFCAFCAFVALALAAELSEERRWVAYALGSVCAAGVVLSFSRGAVLAFAVGAIVYCFQVLRGEKRFRQLVPIVVLLTVGISLFVTTTEGSLFAEIRSFAGSSDEVRPLLWRASISALSRFWALGMGCGAYGFVMSAFQPVRQSTFTFAENEIVQCLVDWGWPLGVLFLLAVGAYALRIARSRSADPFLPALRSALAVSAAHACFDFSLSLLALAIPVVTCAAMLEGRDVRQRRLSAPGAGEDSRVAVRPASRWRHMTACTALSALAAVSARYAIGHETRRDVQALRHTMKHGDAGARMQALEGFAAHHPADFLGPLIVAEREVEAPDGAPRVLRLVNRAMLMAPSFAVVHRIAGRALVKVGAVHQAIAEYRAALDLWPPDIATIIPEVEQRAPGHLLELAEGSPERGVFVARDCTYEGRHCSAELVETLLQVPELERHVEAAELLTRLALKQGQWSLALERAHHLESIVPTSAYAYEAAATAYREMGKANMAREELTRGQSHTGNSTSILLAMTKDAIERNDLEEAVGLANRLVARSSTTSGAADAHSLLATIWEKRERWSDSIRELQRARDASPKTANYYARLAVLYRKIGNPGAARNELRRGIAATAGDPVLKQALASQNASP